jgi:hypothetical protein
VRISHALFVLLAACGARSHSQTGGSVKPTDAAVAERHWRVFDGDLAILELSDRPGPILSTAAPPPGGEPVTHPFLSATALDAAHEDRLHQLLTGSHSVDEFIAALQRAGYRVVPE